MKDVLPSEVLRQPKAGFGAPIDYWLAHELKEMVDDLLSETQIRKRGLSSRSCAWLCGRTPPWCAGLVDAGLAVPHPGDMDAELHRRTKCIAE